MNLTEVCLTTVLPTPGPPSPLGGPLGTRLTFQISQSVRILLLNWGWPLPWKPGPWPLGGLQAAGVMVEGGWAQVEGASGASAGSWASEGLERWTGSREKGSQ